MPSSQAGKDWHSRSRPVLAFVALGVALTVGSLQTWTKPPSPERSDEAELRADRSLPAIGESREAGPTSAATGRPTATTGPGVWGATGFWKGPRPPRRAAATASDAEIRGGAAPDLGPGTREVPRGAGAHGRSDGGPEGAADADAESAEDPPEADQRQPRQLSGWVFDAGGRPVPGLVVSAAARRLFAARPGAVAAGHAPAWTQTRGDGSFVFPQLADGEYLVSTRATEMYEAASTTVRAGVDSAVLTVEEKAGRAIHVFGRVHSDQHSPLDGVRVEPIGRLDRSTHTDGGGAYSLTLASRRAATQAIRFLKEGYRETRLNVSLDEPGEVALDATLDRLAPFAPVSGSVAGDDGSPVHLARVQLYSAELGRSYRTASDRSGRFAFANVEVGEDYRLWVHAPARFRDHVEEPLSVPAQGVDLPVRLEELREARLSGQMVDPDGRSLPGLSLWLVTSTGGRGPVEVRSDAQGRFSVDGLLEGEVALQTHGFPLLTVSGLVADVGSTKSVRLVLDVGSLSVGGHVLDEQDRPLAGARVSLAWSHNSSAARSRSYRETACDVAGYFLFTQLGSGPHTVAVTAPGLRGTVFSHRVGTDEDEIVVRVQGASR